MDRVTVDLLRVMAAAFFAALLAQEPAMCADFDAKLHNFKGHETLIIWLGGEIKPGDDLIFAQLIARSAKNVSLSLRLDSSGGDVDTAMAIGSIVRKHEGSVLATTCFSSYVLIFAGGVSRFVGFFSPGVVGVHRLFFAELQPGSATNEVKARYDAQLNRVRSYLAEMNVAPEFLSFVQSFEPDNIHVMTQEELNRYGLGREDVIYNERMAAKRAKQLGISSLAACRTMLCAAV